MVSALQEHTSADAVDITNIERLRRIRVTGPENSEIPITELAEIRIEKQASHIVTHWLAE